MNMEKSHCYNPFAYLKNDNDVQKMVTNLFKATTPKGARVTTLLGYGGQYASHGAGVLPSL